MLWHWHSLLGERVFGWWSILLKWVCESKGSMFIHGRLELRSRVVVWRQVHPAPAVRDRSSLLVARLAVVVLHLDLSHHRLVLFGRDPDAQVVGRRSAVELVRCERRRVSMMSHAHTHVYGCRQFTEPRDPGQACRGRVDEAEVVPG